MRVLPIYRFYSHFYKHVFTRLHTWVHQQMVSGSSPMAWLKVKLGLHVPANAPSVNFECPRLCAPYMAIAFLGICLIGYLCPLMLQASQQPAAFWHCRASVPMNDLAGFGVCSFGKRRQPGRPWSCCTIPPRSSYHSSMTRRKDVGFSILEPGSRDSEQ